MKNLVNLIKKRIFKLEEKNPYYDLNVPIVMGVGITAVILGAIAAYILTEKWIISIIFGLCVVPFVMTGYCKRYKKKRLRKIEENFFCMLQLILSAIMAGNSPEESFRALFEEYRNGSATNISLIAEDINAINRRVQMNYSFYDELYAFSLKTRSKEIIGCCLALRIAGEKGGSVGYIIKNQISNMRIKLETEDEIETTLKGPKYNQKIITAMPFFLVLMIKSMSEEYIDTLYNTKIGMIIVACVSVVILFAWILGERLSDIEI